jgi:hypothetical protein
VPRRIGVVAKDVTAGLADNFEIADDGVLDEVIRRKTRLVETGAADSRQRAMLS